MLNYVKKLSFEEEPDYSYLKEELHQMYEVASPDRQRRVSVFVFDWEDPDKVKMLMRRSRKVKRTKMVVLSNQPKRSLLEMNNITLDSDEDDFIARQKANSNNRLFEVESQESLKCKGRTSSSMVKASKRDSNKSNTSSAVSAKEEHFPASTKALSYINVPGQEHKIKTVGLNFEVKDEKEIKTLEMASKALISGIQVK